MSDILQQIADNLGVGSYPPLNNSYLYAIADHYGVDTTTSKDLMADILDAVGGDSSTSSDYLQDIVLALGGTVTINGNWMEAWLAITATPPAVAPTNTVPPVISGTNNIGQVLTTTDGTWTGTPAPTFAYQWFRGATAILGQTATTYTIQSQDLHPTAQAITCQVTGTNASGTAVATSNIITPVILPFAFTAKTDNTGVSTSTQFKLPLTTSTGLNIVVDWGDASTSTITSHTDPAVTHTYASAGTYSISITGTLPGFKFNNAGDKLKILNISNWGVLDITTNFAFQGCTNLTCSATDAPTITTTDLNQTFANCTNFNGNIGNWDTSGVNIMEGMFSSATAFNQNIGTWDTSAVTNMFRMFRGATAFNQDISAWDVSQVSNFGQFMTGKTFSNYDAANLDAIYNVWSLNPSGLQNGITIEFNTIKYTAAGQTGKDDLIFNYSWTVNDGGI
jgi:surface protein